MTPDPAVVTAPGEPGPVVRPYALTGGRTRSRQAYSLEALVVTSPSGERYDPRRSPEAQVGDGLVVVHEGSDDAPGTVLLERVLSGLRRL